MALLALLDLDHAIDFCVTWSTGMTDWRRRALLLVEGIPLSYPSGYSIK